MEQETQYCFSYYDNGQLEYKIPFVNNKKNGVANFWYDNGKLSQEKYFIDGKEHGKSKYYNYEGILSKNEDYFNGDLHGDALEFSSTGEVCYHGKFLNGLINGIEFMDYGRYYENSYNKEKCVRITQYKNNAVHGLNIVFDGPDPWSVGVVVESSEGTYQHNIDYHENGQKSREVFYVNRKKHGPLRQWNNDGVLVLEENYLDNIQTGISKYFDYDGTIENIEQYGKGGERHGVKIVFIERKFRSGGIFSRLLDFVRVRRNS